MILVITRLSQNNTMIGKRKYEGGGVAIEEFVGKKPQMDFFYVDDHSEHKKSKGYE